MTGEFGRAFRRDGHALFPALYDAGDITRLDDALKLAKPRMMRQAGDVDGSATRDTLLSQVSSDVAAFVTSERLGALAADLLGCRRVRFMQDVLFEKEAGRGETPWHRDSDFWSFSGAGALTVWIPLQETSLTMSPLRYATGSHLASDPHPLRPIEMALIPLRFRIASAALGLGDVAIHHYKTLHGAPRNREAGHPRRSLSVHLIDADALVRTPRYAGQTEHAERCGWDRITDGAPFTDDIAPLI